MFGSADNKSINLASDLWEISLRVLEAWSDKNKHEFMYEYRQMKGFKAREDFRYSSKPH